METPEAVERLLALLQEYGAETYTIVPEDDNGIALGAIIVVAADCVDEVLAMMDAREAKQVTRGAADDWEP